MVDARGDTDLLRRGQKSLKSGFANFFKDIKERAREKRCRVQVIATDGTPERDFAIAIRKHSAAWNILLRDSESPDNSGLSVSLCDRYGWDHSHADSIFWMVEMMEFWFHADKDALKTFYGNGFRRKALKSNPQVEQISKQDLTSGLPAATKDTSKGKYHKTKHAPALLAKIDPDRVRQAAPNCEKLFTSVLAKLT